ncbi:hypothetical protein HPB52_025046 [Rhipicephalus sanguineus]|uniref:Uncharacterized protein n=1 Tax=Rhipicephalus sanguineus TaxID=34632 RepID=A0A9D4TDK6_RHISA|nr:hypothetical protein HPB52_025046 [Rhipicephalus sanguineus]
MAIGERIHGHSCTACTTDATVITSNKPAASKKAEFKWLQCKAAIILASSDGSVTRRQALERAGNIVNNNRQGGPVVNKGRSFRDALTGGSE